MPVIIHTKAQTLADVPFNTDDNRRLLSDAPQAKRQHGAGICAIIHEDVLEPDGSGNYRLVHTTPSLDGQIRGQITYEVQQKKNQLFNGYPDLLPFLSNGMAELNALPWPNPNDPNLTELITKFKERKCPAMGTGFHIGNGLVVTAAHCVTELGPYLLGRYRLVFDFIDDKAVIPWANVFAIRRIVHYNSNNQAPPAPGAHVFPPPTALPMNSIQVNLAQMAQESVTYDVAILELIALRGDQVRPAALTLQRAPAATGTGVYSIGCSSGLPFIYADGSAKRGEDPNASTVRGIPDATLPLARQGALTADIDVFKGNSGGPLFNAINGQVIGICRSGMVFPWLGDSGGPDVANQTLKNAVQTWIATKPQQGGVVFNPQFLDYYTQLRVLRDNTRVSWIRFKGDSAAIQRVNAFSRTDPFALLSMPLRHFLDNVKGHITVQVTIGDGLNYDLFAAPISMMGDLTVTINGVNPNGAPNTHTGTPLMLPGGAWNGNMITELTWMYTTNPPGAAGVPASPFVGILGPLLLPWEGGILSWDSITLNRTANGAGGFQVAELQPAVGRIRVQFWVPDAAHQGQYLPPFTFELPLAQFTRVPGNNDRWITNLGGRHANPNPAWWTGPL